MHAQAVIGGMYGDEGKGLLTDALSFHMQTTVGGCVVVRSNGGAQAGHTVQRPDGRRHVFHHIGSGALAGAPTYLARRFVAHPMLFLQEREQVQALGGNTSVAIDPRCLVSTPYDIMLNQAVEMARGSDRHGSCGIGFGETIERNGVDGMAILAQDLARPDYLMRTLDTIRHEYLPRRLQALGLRVDALEQWRLDDRILHRFIQDAQRFSSLVPCMLPREALVDDRVVFEGAQGLALDEALGAFPYVTRSMTGLPYILDICKEAGIRSLDVHYGTRAYTTRHGAGPMAFEDGATPPRFHDATNQPNRFQGSLRFSPLQLDYLAQLVSQDLDRIDQSATSVRVGAWVSCLDQMDEQVPVAGGENISRDALGDRVRQAIGGEWVSVSHGPCRENLAARWGTHQGPKPRVAALA